jgi:hypothetical protein
VPGGFGTLYIVLRLLKPRRRAICRRDYDEAENYDESLLTVFNRNH